MTRSNSSKSPPQSGEVDQAMPRGMGGDQRAVQGATTGGGQALRHGPFQDLTMKGLQQWSDPVAEGIPAAARGRDPQSQPLKAATIARVFRPLVRRMMAGLDLVQGDLEHQIGPMGLGAHAEIGGEQESQIELIDRLVDGAARWSAGRESSIASHSGDRGFQGGTAKRSSSGRFWGGGGSTVTGRSSVRCDRSSGRWF